MRVSEAVDAPEGIRVDERVLGVLAGANPGPTLMCVAGLHGNEPAGVHAIRRVLPALEEREREMTGTVVAFAGNLGALGAGRRYLDRDLNRAWTEARLSALRSLGPSEVVAEDREQLELLGEIERLLRASTGAVYALDLHTTSGVGGVFSVFTDALPQRDFAATFPVPMIFGLEELVDGTLLDLLSSQGVVALTVETGHHREPEAIDRAEAALWIAIVSAGLLPEARVPEVVAARALLSRDSGHIPRALEMRYKWDVHPEEGFRMKPGYRNFQPVVRGEAVAIDRGGAVRLTESGRLLMPLYQEQGEDGFFVVRSFSTAWMGVSRFLRRSGASELAYLLPGVRSVPGTRDEVVVDKRIARFFARQLFHLLGFRKMEDAGQRLIMRRRPFDQGHGLRKPSRTGRPEQARRRG
jgi:predicted deacylase